MVSLHRSFFSTGGSCTKRLTPDQGEQRLSVSVNFWEGALWEWRAEGETGGDETDQTETERVSDKDGQSLQASVSGQICR